MASEDTYRLGETAKRMAEAATALLDSLDGQQRQRTTLAFDDDEKRTDWHYVPKDRIGLPLKEMSDAQRTLAHQLIATGWSARSIFPSPSSAISSKGLRASRSWTAQAIQSQSSAAAGTIFGNFVYSAARPL